jgi:hypothetical protein
MSSQFGAFMTTVTLVFALNGCLTRIRKGMQWYFEACLCANIHGINLGLLLCLNLSLTDIIPDLRMLLPPLLFFSSDGSVADTNFQKVLGCIPDAVGVITQFSTLLNFAINCYYDMPDRDSQGNLITYKVGWGFLSFVFCWVAALVRVIMHFCTPVPGGGVGRHLLDLTKGDMIDRREIIIEISSATEPISSTRNRDVRPPSEEDNSPSTATDNDVTLEGHGQRKSEHHFRSYVHALSSDAKSLIADTSKRSKPGSFSIVGSNKPENFAIVETDCDGF